MTLHLKLTADYVWGGILRVFRKHAHLNSLPITFRAIAASLALCNLSTPIAAVDVPININPAIVSSPASASFGGVAIATPSSPIVITINNVGPVAVPVSRSAISAASGGPDYSADFAISANTCSGTIAISGSCQISVVFTPSTTDAEAAVLTLTASSGHVYSTPLFGGAPILSLTLTPASARIPDYQTGGPTLSTATLTWSDGHAYTGSLSVTVDPSGLCAISGLTVVLARTVTAADDGTAVCTVSASP